MKIDRPPLRTLTLASLLLAACGPEPDDAPDLDDDLAFRNAGCASPVYTDILANGRVTLLPPDYVEQAYEGTSVAPVMVVNVNDEADHVFNHAEHDWASINIDSVAGGRADGKAQVYATVLDVSGCQSEHVTIMMDVEAEVDSSDVPMISLQSVGTIDGRIRVDSDDLPYIVEGHATALNGSYSHDMSSSGFLFGMTEGAPFTTTVLLSARVELDDPFVWLRYRASGMASSVKFGVGRADLSIQLANVFPNVGPGGDCGPGFASGPCPPYYWCYQPNPTMPGTCQPPDPKDTPL